MTNPVKGEVEFKAGDTVYTLKLGHNARAEVEGLLGRTFSDIIGELLDITSTRNETVRALLWAGLHQHHPDITLFDVGELMDEVGDEYIGERFKDALLLAAPKVTARPPRKAKQSKAGTTS